ncbi:ABC transporter substrate-binding protein [Candidatus Halobeggiatoa sp. HSG11]|nr:ABC transporter substrate-binding protein [Candidatus Halobeggiatoa sp. HSG11]
MSKIFYVIIFLILGLAVFLLQKYSEPYYIAVAGPMTNINGEAMQQGVQLAIDEINKKDGINGRQIKLKIFDDQNDPNIAIEKAKEIIKGKYLAVIGHYTSGTSLAAAEIYKKHGIPAISGSATSDELTKGNDWYFRVIFNNSDQGALLAYYIKKILKRDKASIIFDSDSYGENLAKTFLQTAKMIDLKIKNQWCFIGDNGGNCPAEQNFADTLKLVKNLNAKKTGIIFLATHSEEAVKIIKAVRNKNNRFPIIGADSLSSTAFYDLIRNDTLEKYQKGYYTDGIYVIAPFLEDLAGKRAIDFKRAFSTKYNKKKLSATSIVYYDATQVILHALKQLSSETITYSLIEKRTQLKENLWKISNHHQAVEGVTGPIYFDRNGDVDQSIPIGVYENGKPTVALSQYRSKHLTQEQSQAKRILPEVFEGNLIKVNGKFRSKAEVVYVGVEFNKITQLKTKESSYMIDFYIWFRSKIDMDKSEIDKLFLDEFGINTTTFDNKIHFDANQIEFVNIVDVKAGQLTNSKMADIDRTITDEKIITKTYRVKAKFKGDFDFHRYPLDRQTLSIQLRHQNKERNSLIYAVDTQGLKMDELKERVKNNNIVALNGWQVHDIALFEDIQKIDSTFGFPKYFNLQRQLEYSRLNIEIEIERHVFSFFWKNLFPNMLIIVLGYGIFFIKAFATQMALGVNLILPTSILHIRLSSELPMLAYFTLLEYTFYLIYFLAVCSLLMVVTMHFHEEDERNYKRTQNIMLAGRIGYPIVVFVGCFLIFF